MNKTVLVTGGAKGIGAACVRAFARAGYNVCINYRTSDTAAKALEEELKKEHVSAITYCADVADAQAVRDMVRACEAEFGHIDVLINNAGISSFGLLTDITPEEWRRMIDVHVTGAFNCCHEVLPKMISRKSGNIINISSIWGETGASCEVHYSTAKAALIGFTKALAKEVGPSGIRVNCISPGVIDTDMNAAFSDDDIKALCDETPLMRIGSPEEVASAVLFLAGEGASFITGQVLGVNGGILI